MSDLLSAEAISREDSFNRARSLLRSVLISSAGTCLHQG
jgi:hypothetical protein